MQFDSTLLFHLKRMLHIIKCFNYNAPTIAPIKLIVRQEQIACVDIVCIVY